MLLVRDIMYCKPGKVRPMVEKFLALSKLMQSRGAGRMRVLTDLVAERYWTVILEAEVESLEAYMAMGLGPEDDDAFGKIMEGYHDLVDNGRRELYTIED